MTDQIQQPLTSWSSIVHISSCSLDSLKGLPEFNVWISVFTLVTSFRRERTQISQNWPVSPNHCYPDYPRVVRMKHSVWLRSQISCVLQLWLANGCHVGSPLVANSEAIRVTKACQRICSGSCLSCISQPWVLDFEPSVRLCSAAFDCWISLYQGAQCWVPDWTGQIQIIWTDQFSAHWSNFIMVEAECCCADLLSLKLAGKTMASTIEFISRCSHSLKTLSLNSTGYTSQPGSTEYYEALTNFPATFTGKPRFCC